ncbi:MAG: sodium/solute symporter [Euryarchaeota archaeon]|nr:sodium/solute symporter [Euryarchaeota archaeon]
MADLVTFAIMLVIYAAAMIYLGYRGYKSTKDIGDWLVAGRRVGPFVVAMSYGATFISAVAIIGFGGQAQVFGLQLLWLYVLVAVVGILIAFIVFGYRTRVMSKTLEALTFLELIGHRFNSRFIQGFGGVVIAIFITAYASAVFNATARLVQVTFGTSYESSIIAFTIIVAVYVLLGGLFAVMWTDTLQGVVMVVGLGLLLVSVWALLGGVIPANEALAALGPTKNAQNGLTSVSPFLSTPFMLVSSLIFGVGIGVLAQPQLAVRFMTAKNNKAIRRGVPIGVIFVFLTTYSAFTVGALSNVIFNNRGIAIPANPDLVMPTLINAIYPSWFVYLFLFAVVSASMSTASSLFHVSGAAVGRDLYDKAIKRGLGGAISSRVTKIATFGVIVVAFFLSLFPLDAIAYICTFSYGALGATFLAPYAATLYWKRANLPGVTASMVGGLAATLAWYVFVFAKTAPKITGINVAPPLGLLDPLFVGIPVSFILLIVVTLLTKKPPEEQIEKAFKGIA